MFETTNHELVFRGLTPSGKAAKFEDEDGRWLTLPVSQIEYDHRASPGETVDVEMPEWLAKRELE